MRQQADPRATGEQRGVLPEGTLTVGDDPPLHPRPADGLEPVMRQRLNMKMYRPHDNHSNLPDGFVAGDPVTIRPRSTPGVILSVPRRGSTIYRVLVGESIQEIDWFVIDHDRSRKRHDHKWGAEVAGGSDSGGEWTGFQCAKCGIVAKKRANGHVLAWSHSLFGEWSKVGEPMPACAEAGA